MENDKILSIVNDVLSKGILQKISKYSGVIADEIASCVSKPEIEKMIDDSIERSRTNFQPHKIKFLENLKKTWDEVPERKRTKILTLLKIENNYMCNMLTSTILLWTFYNNN
jgi:hypothetical protein